VPGLAEAPGARPPPRADLPGEGRECRHGAAQLAARAASRVDIPSRTEVAP